MAPSSAHGLAPRPGRLSAAALTALASVAVACALLLPARAAGASPTPDAAPTSTATPASHPVASPPAVPTPWPLPSPIAGHGVQDFAGVFRPDTIDVAEQSIRQIEATSGPRIVVVTLAAGRAVTNVEAEADARRIDQEWGIGRSSPSGGLVVVYDLDATRTGGAVVMYAGEGLETRVPPDARQRIADLEMRPLLQAGDPDGSLTAGLIALAAQLSPVGPVDSPDPQATRRGGAGASPGSTAAPGTSGADPMPLVVIVALGAVLLGLAIAAGSGSQTRRRGALGAAVARRRRAASLYLSNAQRETAAALHSLVSAKLVEVVRTGDDVTGLRIVERGADGAAPAGPAPDDLDEQALALLARLRAAGDAAGFVPRAALPAAEDVHQAAREAFAGRQPRQAPGDWTWWWPVILFAAEPEAYARAVAGLGAEAAGGAPEGSGGGVDVDASSGSPSGGAV